jgi:glycine betaine/proline transport system substrate-binding protein
MPNRYLLPAKAQGLLLSLLLTFLTPISQATDDTAKPITILTLDWTSQVVMSHIFGKLLEHKGYSIKYLNKPSDSQWFLLSSENAHLQVEVWEGSMAERFDNLVSRKLIIDAGTHDAKTREEWWYPDYVEEDCPGLPDWRALNNCASLFTEGGTKGLYYTGPWEKPDRARIRALHLDFDIVTLSNSDELRRKLESAIKDKKPVMIFNWTPNWVEAVYQGHFVEFPDYAPECETEKSWGINKNLNWDCGNPKDGWLKKAVSKNFPDDWPCALQLVKAISFDNKEISETAALVEVSGLSAEQAAQRWLEQNHPRWQNWLESSQCQP